MRLIGLNREDRRGSSRDGGFVQALLGACCSVLLLALPLWALESVNDIAVDAVTHEHVRDPARPNWQGAGTQGNAAGAIRSSAESWEGVRNEPAADSEDGDDAD